MSKNRSIQVRQHQQTTIERFQGPVPPPEVLAKYDEVVPGAGDRIFAMAERQAAHRQDLEKRVISSNMAAERLGTCLGFILAMTALVGGFYLIATGHSSVGIVSIISSLAIPAGAFAYGKYQQKQERVEKLQPFSEKPEQRQLPDP